MKYPAGGRGDVLLAQPVGRHCSGYGEDSGAGLHLQLFDGMAAAYGYNFSSTKFTPLEKGLRPERLINACESFTLRLSKKCPLEPQRSSGRDSLTGDS